MTISERFHQSTFAFGSGASRAISSPPGIPASRSAMPAGGRAPQTTVTSGRTLRGSLPGSDPVSASLRMLLGTSLWVSTRCWLTWKGSATPAGRPLFRLAVSTRRTAATGSGSLLPTPGTPNGGRTWPADTVLRGNSAYRPNGRKVQIHLHHVVEGDVPLPMLPTPTAMEMANEGNVRLLRQAVLTGYLTVFEANAMLRKDVFAQQGKVAAFILTPTARDWKDGTSVANVPENHLLGRWAVNRQETPIPSAKLSSRWVSRMMGYPDGWLDVA